ncbi:MAG: endonuclease/exonuclease/phosphatase family protein [Prevotella sp.]|nr:endonuclease/exonuclease/phosphatase family protein [Prevotella sp.]
MRKQFFMLLMLVLVSTAASAQTKLNGYAVGFYNLENLFDYTHDEGKNDYEFLPDGSYHWNEMKYTHKLHNMARVLSEMGTDKIPDGCAFIGVSEVENAHCLTDLVAQPALKARGFKFCHIEGPDRRGVDCALLYNPKYFTVKNVKLVPYVLELAKDSTFKTRGFLTVSGELADEHVTVIVCHWPSRFKGSFYRETAGKEVRALKDSLLRDDPNVKVFVMGDMNDDPTNKSMHEGLGAKEDIDKVKAGEMYNPWYNTLVLGHTGTLKYNGSWNLFDQIVMTPNLLNQNGKKDFTTLKYISHQIFRRDYLFQDTGKYKGNTKRTTAGGVWLDGYSDHLPVVVYLAKEAR